MRRRTIIDIVVVTAPTLVALALVLELGFASVVPVSNPPEGYFDESRLLYRFLTPQEAGVCSIGPFTQQESAWRINNHGWNSPIDYSPADSERTIAIIGDSYIEACQVDIDKSYPALLHEKLGREVDVYGFGVSGAPLSQYLHMSRYVADVFDPEIMIFNVIHNDFHESLYAYNESDVHWLKLKVSGREIEEIPPTANRSFVQYDWKKRLLRKSALVRYLYLNLHIKELLAGSPRRVNYNANIDVSAIEDTGNIDVATGYILRRIRAENPGRRIIFVMDAPREDIYQDKDESSVDILHRILRKHCEANGFELLDLTSSMRDDFAANGTKFNSDIDAHWNEYGHQFVATEVARLLLKEADHIVPPLH